MTNVVLIIGQAADPHVERVRQELAVLGVAAFVADPYDTDTRVSLSFAGGECRFQARATSHAITDANISAVWWRLKPGPEYPALSAELRAMQTFRTREWQHALEGLEAALPHARWVNPRDVDRRVRYKAVQLREAMRHGMAIPPTLISNDSAQVAEQILVWEEHVIYKPFTTYFPAQDKAVFTSRVASDFIRANVESVHAAPGIFQALIDKAYELRITVVGDRVFPVRIESQQSASTQLDWRKDYNALSYAIVQLPRAIEENLLRLHGALGLVFGAYDFIVTPDGAYVFLEVNSVGQWLWLEDAVGIGVSRALADLLASPG